jgi:hypothetical protein
VIPPTPGFEFGAIAMLRAQSDYVRVQRPFFNRC